MKKAMVAVLGLACAGSSFAGIEVTVDPSVVIGPIKPMHAVNNGPTKARKSDQTRGNFQAYRDARFPFARTHDSINQATSGGHTVDISAIFPDFDADETDPKSYDFTYTDVFLQTIMDAGTEVFFRLGQTIENGEQKRYHVFPPKDFAKWARICEHVIRHCNEGWADGHRWNIRYWEIWNEPDAQLDEDRHKSAQWQGTKAEFFRFYEVAAKHLKAKFPQLRIGGPALGFRMDWAEEFLSHQEKAGTPIDFFSWHSYARDLGRSSSRAVAIREMLDRHGYAKAESIYDEWNYVKDWTGNFPYSCEVISEAKGAAFVAAVMSNCQDLPVDMLMYYDARPGTVFNGIFDLYTLQPRPAYWAFVNWSRLADLGTQVKSAVAAPTNQSVRATAAVSPAGRTGLLVSRFAADDNVTDTEELRIRFDSGRPFPKGTLVLMTDDIRANSGLWKMPEADGSLVLPMRPNAFAYVEVPAAAASGETSER